MSDEELYPGTEQAEPKEEKAISFDNPKFKQVLGSKLGIPKEAIKHLVLPFIGQHIEIGGIIYVVTYIRENPFRFSASPVKVVDPGQATHGVMQ